MSVYFDIGINGENIGRMVIELYPDVFPQAVENFLQIAAGSTYRMEPRNGYTRQTKRSYSGTKFFKSMHNKYLMGGDIYQNNGTDAGSIYEDKPIVESVPDYFIPHDQAGLVSVVSYEDGDKLYDSTFLITLGADPSLDETAVVIGSITRGKSILSRINDSIIPAAGRRYPIYHIIESGVISSPYRQISEIIVYDNINDRATDLSKNPYQQRRLAGAGKLRDPALRLRY